MRRVPMAAAGAALVFGLVSVFLSGPLELVVYEALLGIALVMAVRALPTGDPGSGRSWWRRRARPERIAPASLAQWERLVTLAPGEIGKSSRRLVGGLRSLASSRLARRHGIDLDHRPEAARRALGEAAWRVIDPAEPDPNPSPVQIEAVVDALERLDP